MPRSPIHKETFFNALRTELGEKRKEFWPGAPGTNLAFIVENSTTGDYTSLKEVDDYLNGPGQKKISTSDIAAIAERVSPRTHRDGVHLRSLPALLGRYLLDVKPPVEDFLVPEALLNEAEDTVRKKPKLGANEIIRTVGGGSAAGGYLCEHDVRVFREFNRRRCDFLKEQIGDEIRVSELPLVAQNFARQIARFERRLRLFKEEWGSSDVRLPALVGSESGGMSPRRGWLNPEAVELYRVYADARCERILARVNEKGLSIKTLPDNLRDVALMVDRFDGFTGELFTAGKKQAHTLGDKHLSARQQSALLRLLQNGINNPSKWSKRFLRSEGLVLAARDLDRVRISDTKKWSDSKLKEAAPRFVEWVSGAGVPLSTIVDRARQKGALEAMLHFQPVGVPVKHLKSTLNKEQLGFVKEAAELDGNPAIISRVELRAYLKLLSGQGEVPLSHQEVAGIRHQLASFPDDLKPGDSPEVIRQKMHRSSNAWGVLEDDVLAHGENGELGHLFPMASSDTLYDRDRPLYDTVVVPGPFFSVCHLSNNLHAPLMVTHALSADDLVYSDLMGLGSNRRDYFHPDGRIPGLSAAPKDIWSGGGKQEDQGHVFSYLDGATVMGGYWSFVFGNIFAQTGQLNRFSWKNLEVAVRDLLKVSGGTMVVNSGVLFLAKDDNGALRPMNSGEIDHRREQRMDDWRDFARNKERNRSHEISAELATAIPEQAEALKKKTRFWSDTAPNNFDLEKFETAFERFWNLQLPRPTHAFKTFVLRMPNGALTTFSIMLRNETDVPTGSSDDRYESFIFDGVTTIDELERLSGLDMFSFLPGDETSGTEKELEAGFGGALGLDLEALKAGTVMSLIDGPMRRKAEAVSPTNPTVWHKVPEVEHALDRLAKVLGDVNPA